MSTTKKPAKKAGNKADKKEDKKKLLTRPLRSVEARSKKKAQSDEKTLPSPELEAPQAGEQLVRYKLLEKAAYLKQYANQLSVVRRP